MDKSAAEPFRLEGRLTVDEVPTVYRRHQDWKEDGLPNVVDLSGLDATDSSAVALLLEWLSWARARDEDIRFDNPPDGLRTIAGLSQVDKLLGWKKDQ